LLTRLGAPRRRSAETTVRSRRPPLAALIGAARPFDVAELRSRGADRFTTAVRGLSYDTWIYRIP